MKATAIFLFLCLLVSCKKSAPKTELAPVYSAKTEASTSKIEMDLFDADFIIGRWESINSEEDGFDLWLNVENQELHGQYCAISEAATRIDCGEVEDDCWVKSPWPISGSRVELKIKSCYSGQMGIAFLEVLEDGLKWKLAVPPGKFGIDHFAPLETTLVKVHFDPFE